MAKKERGTGGGEAGPKPKGKLKELALPVGLALVGAVVGAKFLGGGSTTIVQAGSAPTTTVAPAAGEVVTLDPITMSLADGSVLKIGLAFELNPERKPKVEPAKDDPTKGQVRALDAAIRTLGGLTADKVRSGNLADLLSGPLKEATNDEVQRVLVWTGPVVQQ